MAKIIMRDLKRLSGSKSIITDEVKNIFERGKDQLVGIVERNKDVNQRLAALLEMADCKSIKELTDHYIAIKVDES